MSDEQQPAAAAIGHNSNSVPAVEPLIDPGLDFGWSFDKHALGLGDTVLNPTEISAFEHAVRSQGALEVRRRAIDAARARVNHGGGLSPRAFKIYVAILDVAKLGKTAPSDGADRRFTYITLARLGELAEIHDPNEAACLIRKVEEAGYVAVLRFTRNNNKLAYVAPACTPEDRAGASLKNALRASKRISETSLSRLRAKNSERQRRHRARDWKNGSSQRVHARPDVTGESAVTDVTQESAVTEGVTATLPVTSQEKRALRHGQNTLIVSSIENLQIGASTPTPLDARSLTSKVAGDVCSSEAKAPGSSRLLKFSPADKCRRT